MDEAIRPDQQVGPRVGAGSQDGVDGGATASGNSPAVVTLPVPAARPLAESPQSPAQMTVKLIITQLKDRIMATAPTNDDMKQIGETVSASMTEAMNEAQGRARDAYEKSSAAVGEMSDFTKGNVEALVESSKILAAGLQDIGKTYAQEAKAAYEQVTGDMKEVASVKSPTELFQLQGKIMRRNFDLLVAANSRSTEAMMKLANDAFAPLSGRMSVAADKMAKPI